MSGATSTPRLCLRCGTRVASKGHLSCSTCRRTEPDTEHELTGGRWVRDHRGISRWVPDEPEHALRPLPPGEHSRAVAENVEFLLQHDPWATAQHLADRLGYGTRDGVVWALKRAGRPDLIATLARNAKHPA